MSKYEIYNNNLLIIRFASFKKARRKFYRFEICAPYSLLVGFNFLQHTYKTLQVIKLSVSNVYSASEKYGSTNVYNFNPLTPKDHYRGRTAPLTSKISFYIFIQQI